MVEDSGQAGANIEVSPLMISEGARVLRLAALSAEPFGEEESLATDVFFAMLRVSKSVQPQQ